MARIDLDASRNKYAVYNGDLSDPKLLNPLANLPSMKWHADLEYIGAVKTIVVTLDLDVRTWPGGAIDRAVVSHGMGYRPLILGYIEIGGKVVPTQGEFLVQMGTGVWSYNFYADATSIRLRAQPCQYLTTFKSTPITATLHVCNVGTDSTGQPVRNKTPYAGLEVTPTRFRAGTFDTDEKHFSVSSAGLVMFYTGASLNISLGYSLAHPYCFLGIIQNVLTYSVKGAVSIAGVQGGLFSGNNASYQPSLVRTDCL